MAKIFLAATVLSGILSVSGCMGPLLGGGEYGGGGEQYYGESQTCPYDPGGGGYYEAQPSGYAGTTEAYAYQPSQAVYPGGCPPPPGRWQNRRQQQAHFRGPEGRMRSNGNLSPQERARLNAMQQRRGQDMYRVRQNGMQAGPRAQARPTRSVRPPAQMRRAPQPRVAAQPRTTTQRRTTTHTRSSSQRRHDR
jgi:hypothetical protein